MLGNVYKKFSAVKIMKRQNILTFERYGNKNHLQKVLTNIKNTRTINPLLSTLLRSKGLRAYIPKLNKFKIGFVCGCVLLCVLTPATNWAIPFLISWALR
jgi:hypothetical protein